MALTNNNLVVERPHQMGGVQRIYRFASGYGLSVTNCPMIHSYPFAWEAAVIVGVTDKGDFDDLSYDTPLTSDVEVFMSDEQANEFIERAAVLLATRPSKPVSHVKGR